MDRQLARGKTKATKRPLRHVVSTTSTSTTNNVSYTRQNSGKDTTATAIASTTTTTTSSTSLSLTEASLQSFKSKLEALTDRETKTKTKTKMKMKMKTTTSTTTTKMKPRPQPTLSSSKAFYVNMLVRAHEARRTFNAYTHIGLRPAQEDRLVVVPRLFDLPNLSLAAVFDGTSGDFASHYCQTNLVNTFRPPIDIFIDSSTDMNSPAQKSKTSVSASTSTSTSTSPSTSNTLSKKKTSPSATPERLRQKLVSLRARSRITAKKVIAKELRNCFLRMDAGLLEAAKARQIHYAASTGVVAVLWDRLLSVAHVGDSKVSLCRIFSPEYVGH